MRKLALLSVAFALVAGSFYGCDETKLTEPSVNNAESAVDVADNTPSQAPLLSQENSEALLPFWTTGGNANTNPSSQFLGTLDNQSLAFRTNGVEALRVTTDGRVGIGTTNPTWPLHIVNGTASGELIVEETRPGQAVHVNLKNTARTWTLKGDADPDYLTIAGAGSGRSPFTILGGSGRVGIGTITPVGALHVTTATGGGPEVVIEDVNTGNASLIVLKNTTRSWNIEADASPDVLFIGGGSARLTMLGNGNVGLGMNGPLHPLHMSSGAYEDGGVWTNASSRTYKENIRNLTSAEARTALNGLTPVQFNYKAGGDAGYVGFIAEDVPDLVATQDRKGLSSMDIVAVLTKVVQQQEGKISELEARLDALQ
jgi:hypothetical protein